MTEQPITVLLADLATLIREARVPNEQMEEMLELVSEIGVRERRLMVPPAVWERAVEVFGRQIMNVDGRTHRWIEVYFSHCIRIWDASHGPLNDAQRAYAERVLLRILDVCDKPPNGTTAYQLLIHHARQAATHGTIAARFVALREPVGQTA